MNNVNQIEKVLELIKTVNIQDLKYDIERYQVAYELLMTKYAPFKLGDRVELIKTPEINDSVGWGWKGSKHFLITGAKATIKQVDIHILHKEFCYGLVFDNESYLQFQTHKPVYVCDADKHIYCFGETYIKLTTDNAVEDNEFHYCMV